MRSIDHDERAKTPQEVNMAEIIPKGTRFGEWELLEDLRVNVVCTCIAQTVTGPFEWGEGETEYKATHDLASSLGELRESLEGFTNLGPDSQADLDALRKLIRRVE